MGSNVPQARRVKFKTFIKDQDGPRASGSEVIDENSEYAAWIAACGGDTDRFPRPPDFGQTMLLAVSLGEQRSAGFDVEIVGVVEIVGGFVGIQWEVLYRITEPRGPVAQTLTAPHHVVATRRFEGVITFRRHEVPLVTTKALGEEEPQPPMGMRGAEALQHLTTLMVGEEGPPPTTERMGEEGHPTTFAFGEEDPSTLRWGEENPSTSRWGEEEPTTFRMGEEGPFTTLRFGEEGPTTFAWGEEDPWGGGGGGGGGNPFGGY